MLGLWGGIGTSRLGPAGAVRETESSVRDLRDVIERIQVLKAVGWNQQLERVRCLT